MYHANCNDAQTDQSLLWSYFPQVNVLGKQNKSHKKRCCVKRGMYPIPKLILVFAIRTCYLCHFSWYMYSPIRSRSYGCVTKFTFLIPRDPKIVYVNVGDCPQNPKVFYLNNQYDRCASVVALSAPANRRPPFT